MKNIVISLFGSSIMEGTLGVKAVDERYYLLLQKKLTDRFPNACFSIVNGAVGGWSTRELMQKFDEFVLKYDPDYCLVMFGANNHDLSRPERVLADGELDRLMNDFQARLPERCQRVGVVLNPIINERHWTFRDPNPVWQEAFKACGGCNEMNEPEREEARTFYRKNNYPVIDLAELMASDPARYICDDGIHLSPAGHELFADAAFEVLEQLLIKNGI